MSNHLFSVALAKAIVRMTYRGAICRYKWFPNGIGYLHIVYSSQRDDAQMIGQESKDMAEAWTSAASEVMGSYRVIDHVDGNLHNNRPSNLRVMTLKENL